MSEVQHLAPIGICCNVLFFQFFRQERLSDKFDCHGIHRLEHHNFLMNNFVRKSDPPSKFHEVIMTDIVSISFVHPFFEQTFIKGKYPRFIKLKRGIYKIISW